MPKPKTAIAHTAETAEITSVFSQSRHARCLTWARPRTANQLCVHSVEVIVSLVAELMPKLIGVSLPTRLNDGLVQFFELIELCNRHQRVRATARKEQTRGYGFGDARKGFYRISDLVRRHCKVGNSFPRLRPTRMRKIGVAPFR